MPLIFGERRRLMELDMLKKYRFHIMIWLFMLGYLTFAPYLYVRFVLKNGKPIQFQEKLPAATDLISFWVDRADPFFFQGELLYDLWGWAFLREESDQSQYERFIVLQSDAREYYFPVQIKERTDVQEAFPDLTIDIRSSGFSAFIAKDAIRPGSYHIGIIFRHQSGNFIYLVVTENVLVRTANQLQLFSNNSQP